MPPLGGEKGMLAGGEPANEGGIPPGPPAGLNPGGKPLGGAGNPGGSGGIPRPPGGIGGKPGGKGGIPATNQYIILCSCAHGYLPAGIEPLGGNPGMPGGGGPEKPGGPAPGNCGCICIGMLCPSAAYELVIPSITACAFSCPIC